MLRQVAPPFSYCLAVQTGSKSFLIIPLLGEAFFISATTEFLSSSEDEILDRWIFSANDSLVREVWSAGRLVVVEGHHIKHEQIEKRYRNIFRQFLATLKLDPLFNKTKKRCQFF